MKLNKTKIKSKNFKLATSFYDYCCAHPQERFYQALRNWAGVDFFIKANLKNSDIDWDSAEDTFYWSGKNN